MARCDSKLLYPTDGLQDLTTQDEIYFEVLKDIEACVRVSANKFDTSSNFGGVYSSNYRALNVPKDEYNCNPMLCVNTGTNIIKHVVTTAGADVQDTWNGVVEEASADWGTGLVSFYVWHKEPCAVLVRFCTTGNGMVDYDEYGAVVRSRTDYGFDLVEINLASEPAATVGAGWTPSSDIGADIAIVLTTLSTSTDYDTGISSFAIFREGIDELHQSEVVVLGCLSDISANETVSPKDSACFGATLDDTTIAAEQTITATAVSGNYAALSSLSGEEKPAERAVLVKKKVKLNSSGKVRVPDMADDECGFVSALLETACGTQAFRKVNVGDISLISGEDFAVVDKTFCFDSMYADQSVIITYLKVESGTVREANKGNINSKRVRMLYTKRWKSGKVVQEIRNNVLVTSFPLSLAQSGTTFQFTISVQPDQNGNYYEAFTAS